MFCEVYDTDSLFYEVSELTINSRVEVRIIARCSSKTNDLRDIDSIGCRARDIDI